MRCGYPKNVRGVACHIAIAAVTAHPDNTFHSFGNQHTPQVAGNPKPHVTVIVVAVRHLAVFYSHYYQGYLLGGGPLVVHFACA